MPVSGSATLQDSSGNSWSVTLTGTLALMMTESGQPTKPVPGPVTSLAAALTGSTALATWGLPATGGPLDQGVFQTFYGPHGGPVTAKGPQVPYVTPGVGSITDSKGNVWTVTASGLIDVGGKPLAGPNGVILLCQTPDGAMWQQTTGFEINGQPSWWSTANVGQTWAGPVATSPFAVPGVSIAGLTTPPYDVGVTVSNSGGASTMPVVEVQAAPPAGAIPFPIGYGGGGQFGPSAGPIVAAEEKWLGRPLDLRNGTLSMGTGSPPNMNGYAVSSNGKKCGLIVSMEILNNGWGGVPEQQYNDLQVAANGGYNDVYTTMLQGVIALGYPIVILRPAWEFNGDWMGWSPGGNPMGGGPQNKNCTPQNFIGAFKQVAQIARKLQPGIQIDWACNWQSVDKEWGSNPPDFWVGKFDPNSNPGGADTASMDVYDSNVGGWSGAFNALYGLGWLEQFTVQNGIGLGCSEIGIAQGNGETGGGNSADDVAFAQSWLTWFRGLPNARYFYISAWSPSLDLSAPNLAPNTQAYFNQQFAGTHFANPGWYTGAKLPSQP